MIPHDLCFILFILREPLVAEMVYYTQTNITDGVMLGHKFLPSLGKEKKRMDKDTALKAMLIK